MSTATRASAVKASDADTPVLRRPNTSRAPLLQLGARPAAIALVGAWFASRLLLLVLLTRTVTPGRGFTAALSAWDAENFAKIATSGYGLQANPQATDVAFFPGLPLAMRALSVVGIPPVWGGALLATICSGLAAWALYLLGCRGWGLGTGWRLTGLVAATLWLFAPTTVFTSLAYTEAPFCAAAFWAWLLACRRQWWQAGLLAALACTLRVSGLFLLGALVLLVLVGNRPSDKPVSGAGARVSALARTVLPGLVVLGAYATYLHRFTGSWTTWYHAQQKGWSRDLSLLADAFAATVNAGQASSWQDRPLVAIVFRQEVVAMGIAVLLVVLLLKLGRWADAGWVGVMVLALGTSHWYMSVTRAGLLWFPLFIALAIGVVAVLERLALLDGDPASGRPRIGLLTIGVCATLLGLLATGAGYWAWLYYSGNWAS